MPALPALPAGAALGYMVRHSNETAGSSTYAALWGGDPGLAAWLAERGVRAGPFAPAAPAARVVILHSGVPPAPGGAAAFRELARRIARGSCAVFLTPSTLRRRDDAAGWGAAREERHAPGAPVVALPQGRMGEAPPDLRGALGRLAPRLLAPHRELMPDAAWTDQEPLADLPADFEEALDTMGCRER